MKDIFRLPKLLIKKKLKILNENEKQSLEQLRKKYHLHKEIDYHRIIDKTEYYDTINKDDGWNEFTKKQQLVDRKSIIPLKIFKYAAVFIGIIGVGAYLFLITNNTPPLSVEESITLQLENGDIEYITSGEEQKIVDTKGQLIGIQKGKQLKYVKEKDKKELVYNELTVPYGKKFELVLSDNTRVYLNAGTSLKYPVQFISGKNRQVFLKGEAYFDVAKDSIHPFMVNAADIDVKVLGTQFNVSAYPEEHTVNTVLVEGAVNVSSRTQKDSSLELQPSHRAIWNKESKRITVDKVDTNIYTGWIVGKLIFKNVPFSEICRRLERHYNLTIVNKNEALKSERFDATFDIETIEQVLQSFKENHSTLNYTINNDNHITIY